MDRKTRRKLRRELKKMSLLELAGLVNALAKKETAEVNSLYTIKSIKIKED